MTKHDTILIVGLGLMGGSYAMGLSKRGYRVTALDKSAESIAWAAQNGLIAAGATTDDGPSATALTAAADYIVLALYPADILPWLQNNKAHFKKGALLTDLAGVKTSFVQEAQALLAPGHEFIPSHPMAGREVSGVQNATDAMFVGANFLITPTAANTQRGIAFAHTLASTLEFGRITTLGIEEHDRMIGYVSQLTHAIAVSLMNANSDERLSAVTGDSFRDLTRIADINDGLWSELFLQNAPALVAEIDDFTKSLQQVRTALVEKDRPALRTLMRKSAVRRRSFNKS